MNYVVGWMIVMSYVSELPHEEDHNIPRIYPAYECLLPAPRNISDLEHLICAWCLWINLTICFLIWIGYKASMDNK
jgi:hypothetical protein